MLTYLELLQEFDKWQDTRRLDANEIALWFALARIWNDAGRPKEIYVPSVIAESKSGLSRMGVFRARKKLVNHGLIEYNEGKRNIKAPVYRLLTPWTACKDSCNNSDSCNSSCNSSCNDSCNSSCNNSDFMYHSGSIYNNNINNKHNIYNVPPEKSNRFKKPTLEELKNFIQENNYQVDAERFFDYYEANGWTVGKNKPMKNWQAAIRNWNRNSYSNTGYSDEVNKPKKTEPEEKVMINSYEEMPF